MAGCVVAVVKDGKILVSRGYGFADIENAKPMDPTSTLIRPGSITKLFTWTAIMQLAEEGKIDLDADVNGYLDFKIPEAFDEPITIRHLMTHTPGFEETNKNLIGKDSETIVSLENYVKRQLPQRVFAPGKVPAYSNYGSALAGYIVERVSGTPFDTYVEQKIFAPLAMRNSTMHQPLPRVLRSQMANGYSSALAPQAQYFELVNGPAGGAATTVDDLARFMIAHLDEGGALLKPETARLMHTVSHFATPGINGMALGFFQRDRHGVSMIGHGGDTQFFHSDMTLFPEHGVGIVVSVNSGSAPASDNSILREQLISLFVRRYLEGSGQVTAERIPAATRHAALVDGQYETSRASMNGFMAIGRYLGQASIDATEDGDLAFPYIEGPSLWREVEPLIWMREGSDERLAAKLAADGSVTHLAFEQRPDFVLTPVPWHRSSNVLTPTLGLSVAVLTLFLISWPVAAFMRKRHGVPLKLAGRAKLQYLGVRLAAIGTLFYLVAWAVFTSVIASDVTAFNAHLDPSLRVMQVGQVLLYLALAMAVGNAAATLRLPIRTMHKIGALLIPLAVANVIWFAFIAGFLSFTLKL
jgi:CubicO group peptidase (beta-lactamase class C family)